MAARSVVTGSRASAAWRRAQRRLERRERGRVGEGDRGQHPAVDVGDGLRAGELPGAPLHRQPERRRGEEQREQPGLDSRAGRGRATSCPRAARPGCGRRRPGCPPWPGRGPGPGRGPAPPATRSGARRRWPARSPRVTRPGARRRRAGRRGLGRAEEHPGDPRHLRAPRASRSPERSGATSRGREPHLAAERARGSGRRPSGPEVEEAVRPGLHPEADVAEVGERTGRRGVAGAARASRIRRPPCPPASADELRRREPVERDGGLGRGQPGRPLRPRPRARCPPRRRSSPRPGSGARAGSRRGRRASARSGAAEREVSSARGQHQPADRGVAQREEHQVGREVGLPGEAAPAARPAPSRPPEGPRAGGRAGS